MAFDFNGAQVQVHEWINQHPDGYFPDEKLITKLKEEGKEIEEALIIYRENPSEENKKAMMIEIGDELFALICITNSNGFDLKECFDLMMEKNRNRAKNNYKKEVK